MSPVTFLIIALLLAVPAILQFALRVPFPVHKEGAIVISGCSTGIGRHAAFQLAQQGYSVFAGVRKQKDVESLNTQASTASLKGKIIPIILEVTKQEDIDNAFKTVEKFLKEQGLPFVGLLNNAGISSRGPLESLDVEKARKLFDINFWGAVALTQKFAPLIRQHQGRIVFVSSVMGALSLYGSTAYSSSKWALEAAVDSLRLEMLDFGVSVSCIQPGYIVTAIEESGRTEPQGTPEQIALYKSFWDEIPAKRAKSFASGASPQVTSDAILHAFANQYPHTRYSPGPAGPFNGETVVLLTSFLPDRLLDLIKKNSS